MRGFFELEGHGIHLRRKRNASALVIFSCKAFGRALEAV